MPGYVARALTEFHHQTPRRKEDSSYDMAPRKYGAASQEVDEPKASLPVSKADQKFIQKVRGKCLYLGCSVDTTLLTSLSAIAARQASPTKETMERTRKLLDCVASQEDAVITYHASEMVLAVHRTQHQIIVPHRNAVTTSINTPSNSSEGGEASNQEEQQERWRR